MTEQRTNPRCRHLVYDRDEPFGPSKRFAVYKDEHGFDVVVVGLDFFRRWRDRASASGVEEEQV